MIVNIGIKKEFSFTYKTFPLEYYIYRNIDLNHLTKKMVQLLEKYNKNHHINNDLSDDESDDENDIETEEEDRYINYSYDFYGDYRFLFLEQYNNEKISYNKNIKIDIKYEKNESYIDEYNQCHYQFIYKSFINIGITQIYCCKKDEYYAYINVDLDKFTKEQIDLLDEYNNREISIENPKFEFLRCEEESSNIKYYEKLKYFFTFIVC
jgi:hypothetical protein